MKGEKRPLLLWLGLAVWAWLVADNAWAQGRVLVLGDSLSAGYGFHLEQAWPKRLEERIQLRMRAKGHDYKVINASISGETTAGGLSRLPALLDKHQPEAVILVLGANDGLRGLPLASMEKNLVAMIRLARQQRSRVMLVGMRLPPNYGRHGVSFAAVFSTVARQEKIPFIPFLLESIADRMEWFQPDGLHPVAEAQERILDHLWPDLERFLESGGANRAPSSTLR